MQLLSSYNKIGAQSAVKTAIGNFLKLVIAASAAILFFVCLNFSSIKTNLLL
jgi:hypothetical protein